jgi:hypothetical protein
LLQKWKMNKKNEKKQKQKGKETSGRWISNIKGFIFY